MDLKKHLPITLPVLYVGLKNNWLTGKEVVTIINNNSEKLNCDEKTWFILTLWRWWSNSIWILKEQAETEEHTGIILGISSFSSSYWQSDLSFMRNLINWIAMVRFGLSRAWSNFIYYMPNNEKVKTEKVISNFFKLS